jgi:hypothetical protein
LSTCTYGSAFQTFSNVLEKFSKRLKQGCQIFLGTKYQNGEIYTEGPQNIPRFSIARPPKIYPNWDFWFENKPSGNPVLKKFFFFRKKVTNALKSCWKPMMIKLSEKMKNGSEN